MLQKALIIVNMQLNFQGQYGPAQKLCRVSLWLYVFKFFFHLFQPFRLCIITEQHSHASLGPDQPPTIFSQTAARSAEHAARFSVPWVTTLRVTAPVLSPSEQSPALPCSRSPHTARAPRAAEMSPEGQETGPSPGRREPESRGGDAGPLPRDRLLLPTHVCPRLPSAPGRLTGVVL